MRISVLAAVAALCLASIARADTVSLNNFTGGGIEFGWVMAIGDEASLGVDPVQVIDPGYLVWDASDLVGSPTFGYTAITDVMLSEGSAISLNLYLFDGTAFGGLLQTEQNSYGFTEVGTTEAPFVRAVVPSPSGLTLAALSTPLLMRRRSRSMPSLRSE